MQLGHDKVTCKQVQVRCRYLNQILLVLFVLLLTVDVQADDYLDSLEAEVGKVENHSFDDSVEPKAEPNAEDEVLLRHEFEQHLSQKNKGSYTLYKKLPERSRQEVYEEFTQGASMSQIRRMIVDRILQR